MLLPPSPLFFPVKSNVLSVSVVSIVDSNTVKDGKEEGGGEREPIVERDVCRIIFVVVVDDDSSASVFIGRRAAAVTTVI